MSSSQGRPVPEALLAIACAPLFAVAVKSWDVWWHLATGRWIVANGALPTTDPFSYTMAGEPWRLVNGLSEVVLYGFVAIFGISGAVVAKMVFATLTILLTGLAARATGARRLVTLATMLAVGLLIQARYSYARPLIMGATLVAAGNLVALRLERDARPRWLWFFVALLPIWPLIHGSALVGLGQLVVAVGALALKVDHRQTALRRGLPAIGIVALAIAVVGPWRDLLGVAAGLGQGVTATQLTAEWASGFEELPVHLGRWLFVALGVVGSASVFRERRVPLALSLMGVVLALRFGRNIYEAMLLSAPGFAIGLENTIARVVARRGEARPLVTMAMPIFVALFLPVVQLVTAPRRAVNTPFGLGVMEGRYPDDALATLAQLPEGRLIHGFPLGGYLIYRGIEVYIDGRTVALYREKDIQALFMPLLESAEALTKSADRWQAPYGLAQHRSIPAQWMMISPEWVPVHLAASTTLYVRRKHLDRLPPDIKPLHLVRYARDPQWTQGWYAGIVKDPSLRAQLAEEMTAARARGDSPLLYRILEEIAALDSAYADELARRIGARSR